MQGKYGGPRGSVVASAESWASGKVVAASSGATTCRDDMSARMCKASHLNCVEIHNCSSLVGEHQLLLMHPLVPLLVLLGICGVVWNCDTQRTS